MGWLPMEALERKKKTKQSLSDGVAKVNIFKFVPSLTWQPQNEFSSEKIVFFVSLSQMFWLWAVLKLKYNFVSFSCFIF